MFKLHLPLAFLVTSLLTACAYMPTGPSMIALASPGSDKNFDQFRNDDHQCRQFAHEQVSGISADNTSAWIVQQCYDTSYLQCMYAQGPSCACGWSSLRGPYQK